jgi:1,4-dihydroxy-2-naphthoyl-CoA synthase
MTDEIVLYEARYPAAIITLNNPDHRNALSPAMIDALMAAIARAEQDRGVRALVFTGLVPHFPPAWILANCVACSTSCAATNRDRSGRVRFAARP